MDSNKSSPATEPMEPRRVRAFAHFFKRYMSISSLVTASLPIPVTTMGLIPTYKAQTMILSTYTPLFCFLILGFIFYSRHQLARLMFPEYFGRAVAYKKINLPLFLLRQIKITWHGFIGLLPLILIAASIFCVFSYHVLLAESVKLIKVGAEGVVRGKSVQELVVQHQLKGAPAEIILSKADQDTIPFASELMVYYLAIFLTAEASFILMAIKEYLQDLVGLTEMDLIGGSRPESGSVGTTSS